MGFKSGEHAGHTIKRSPSNLIDGKNTFVAFAEWDGHYLAEKSAYNASAGERSPTMEAKPTQGVDSTP